MARRYTGNMMGERYLANRHNVEVHDLDNEKTGSWQCQIDDIIAKGHDKPYDSLSTANSDGYDNCAYCIGNSTR